jgi:[acyl-carrier-protein] S-malonyltransferase
MAGSDDSQAASRIVLCPGQGAQFVGMGKAWAEKSEAAAAVFARADAVLADRLGAPLSRLCFEEVAGAIAAQGGRTGGINRTDVSQPAIYTASVACWRGLLAQWGAGANSGVGEGGVIAAAGLSLGEYTALHLAGCFSIEDGLELVPLRGRAMQEAAEAAPSGMVALIGADEAQAEIVCEKALAAERAAGSGGVLVCANFNAPGQVVISGSKAACARAETVAAEMGLRAAALPVAGAFHSPLMAPAAERLAAALERTPVERPRATVISNVTARPHAWDEGGRTIKRRLVEQLTSPVRWAESCANLIAGIANGTITASGREAAGSAHPPVFLELAPGKTLAGLMRRIDRGVKVETHDEPSE